MAPLSRILAVVASSMRHRDRAQVRLSMVSSVSLLENDLLL